MTKAHQRKGAAVDHVQQATKAEDLTDIMTHLFSEDAEGHSLVDFGTQIWGVARAG